MQFIETERMILSLASNEEMEKLIEDSSDDVMRWVYSEMLEGAKLHPDKREFYAVWLMLLKKEENRHIGDLSFKGITEDGIVEIGYGIKPGYEGNGYMTEAVSALVKWAFERPEVSRVEAEAKESNIASIRVLTKAGFIPNGIRGEEGPRFVYKGNKLNN